MAQSILTEPARIHAVEIDNFKRIVTAEVEFDPDQALVQITGPNAAGKSSFLDAIEACVGGGKSQPIKPVRDGARKTRVKLDLGKIVVERTHDTKGKTSVKVRGKDGVRYTRPQQVLDDLYEAIALDPLAFDTLTGKQQRDALAGIMGLTETLEKLEAERVTAYEKRRVANRDCSQLRAALDHSPSVPPGTPDEVVDAEALSRELTEANKSNQTATEDAQALADAIEDLQGAEAEVEASQNRLACLRTQLGFSTPADIPRQNTTGLQAKLTAATGINLHVANKGKRAQIKHDLKNAEQRAEAFDHLVKKAEAAKTEAVASAKPVIEGLDFTEDGLVFNGQPLEQASQAQRLEVFMSIAMAKNPLLRFILIRDGSLLDMKHLAFMAAVAQREGYQIIMERVRDEGGVGVFFEEGEITSIDGKQVKKIDTEEIEHDDAPADEDAVGFRLGITPNLDEPPPA